MVKTEGMSPARSQGYLISLLSALVLSTTAILIRYLTETYALPALVLAFWRALFVVLSLFSVLLLLRRELLRVSKNNLRYLAFYGLVLACFNSFWTVSVSVNGAAISTVLAYSSTMFTALLGRWLLKEGLDWAKVLAVILTLGGCVLISGVLDLSAWQGSWGGLIVGVGSGLFYASYSLMGRSASQRGLNPWTTLFYSFGFGTVFLFLFNLLPADLIPGAADGLSGFLWLGDRLAGWGLLMLLAAGPTLLGYGLYNMGLEHLPSSIVNLIVTAELIFTTAQAYLFLGERLHAYELGGGLLIMVGVVVLRWREGWRARREAVVSR
jgi:drug/metabolite transporter (DMT)-like permease